MSNYYTLKNSALYTPSETIDLASNVNSFKELYIGGNVVINNSIELESVMLRPQIAELVYVDDTLAARTTGGESIKLRGYNFKPNAVVKIANVAITTTVVSQNEITFTAPARSAGNYIITVTNVDGGTSEYIPGIEYSPIPAWQTSNTYPYEGYEGASINYAVRATAVNIPLRYNLVSGGLPSTFTLVSENNQGVFTGQLPKVSSVATYTANVRVIDYQNQVNYREFSFMVYPDEITWVSHPNTSPRYVYDYYIGDPVNIVLSATLASERAVSFMVTSGALNPGLQISQDIYGGWSITGTVSDTGTEDFTVTAFNNSSGATSVNRPFRIAARRPNITWTMGVNNSYTINDGDAIPSITISATSESPNTVISYVVTSLPDGITVTDNVISGTLTLDNYYVEQESIFIAAYDQFGNLLYMFDEETSTRYTRNTVYITVNPRLGFISNPRESYFAAPVLRTRQYVRIDGINYPYIAAARVNQWPSGGGGVSSNYRQWVHFWVHSTWTEGVVDYGNAEGRNDLAIIYRDYVTIPYSNYRDLNSGPQYMCKTIYMSFRDIYSDENDEIFYANAETTYKHSAVMYLADLNKPISGYSTNVIGDIKTTVNNIPQAGGDPTPLSIDFDSTQYSNSTIFVGINDFGWTRNDLYLERNFPFPNFDWRLVNKIDIGITAKGKFGENDTATRWTNTTQLRSNVITNPNVYFGNDQQGRIYDIETKLTLIALSFF